MNLPLHKRIVRDGWLHFAVGLLIGACLYTAGTILLGA